MQLLPQKTQTRTLAEVGSAALTIVVGTNFKRSFDDVLGDGLAEYLSAYDQLNKYRTWKILSNSIHRVDGGKLCYLSD